MALRSGVGAAKPLATASITAIKRLRTLAMSASVSCTSRAA